MTVIRRGVSYPPTYDGSGGLVLSEDADRVEESFYEVLETLPGERVRRPLFGTPDYTFSSVANSGFIPSRIRICLIEQIYDPDAIEVKGEIGSDGKFYVYVTYYLAKIKQPPIALRLSA